MPKVAPGAYVYAVAKGRRPGVYLSWKDCEAQVTGFPGEKYRRFRARADGDAWLRANGVGDVDVEHGDGDEHGRGDEHGNEPSASATLCRVAPPPTFVDPPTAPATTTTPTTTSTTKTTPEKDDEETRIVYCDGACRGNGRAGSVAGVGVFWGLGDVRNIAERCPGNQTNNRAELVAIARVLETTPVDATPLVIRTDSKYSIQCLTLWLPKWRQTAWRTGAGKPVANRALISYVDALLEERRGAGQRVTLEHVYGHTGDAGNDGADAQANLGCTASPNLNLNADSNDPSSTQSIPDRDWAALEKAVRERMEEAAMWRAVEAVEASTAASGSGSSKDVGKERKWEGEGKAREEEEAREVEEAREPRTRQDRGRGRM